MTDPVTTVVRRRVIAGREAEYEAWLQRLTTGARTEAPGYLGTEIHRPTGPGGDYRSIFRFASLADLERFEASSFRASMMAEGAPLFAGDAVWHRLTGLELWFDPPPGTRAPQPSQHRMALVLVAVVYALVLALNLALGPLMHGWPLALRLLVTVVLQVGLMTYLIMPRLTRRLARFIYPAVTTI